MLASNSNNKNLNEIAMEDIKLPAKYIHNELNQNIWEDEKLKAEIQKSLKKIADDFYSFLKIETPIEGVWFTGSLANYNWSNFSDVDLHVLVDYKKINKDLEFVTEYLDAKKDNWNNLHNIKIKGFDVELYAQDINEEHRSTGVYDVLKNEWIRKPSKESPSINKKSIKSKIKSFVDKIEKIESIKDYEEAQEKGKSLKNKIKKMRKSGLEKSGEFSEENLVFKYLRNNGYIARLFDKMRDSYDKSVSVNENQETAIFDYDEDVKLISSSDLINIVKSLHNKNKEIFDENLSNKINQFNYYKLSTIPSSTINIDNLNVDEEVVERFIEMTKINPDYPPIIFNPIEDKIIDGEQRFTALKRMGHDTIRAYVGVEENKDNNNTMSESARKLIRKNMNEFFNSAGFHASMEDWIKKWQKKGIDISSDSYGDGMDMGFKKGTILSEEKNEKDNYDYREVEIGTEVEKEHTKDEEEALKIALVHIKENNKYYFELGKSGLIDEEKAKALWEKYYGDKTIEESEFENKKTNSYKKFFEVDNIEKLKNISKIVYGITGDEEMAMNMLLSQADSTIYIPLDVYMDEEILNKLLDSLTERGYNISNISTDEIEIDLANPVYSLNENRDNFYTLAPKKHQIMFEKNLQNEHGDNVEDFKNFISFCCKEGEIKEPTIIHFRGTRDENLKTTASYNPSNHHVHIYCKGRHKVDIMRSLAHELMHMIQMLENRLNDNSGADGSPEENEAHSFAGLMIRKFGKLKPEIYEGYKNNKQII